MKNSNNDDESIFVEVKNNSNVHSTKLFDTRILKRAKFLNDKWEKKKFKGKQKALIYFFLIITSLAILLFILEFGFHGISFLLAWF